LPLVGLVPVLAVAVLASQGGFRGAGQQPASPVASGPTPAATSGLPIAATTATAPGASVPTAAATPAQAAQTPVTTATAVATATGATAVTGATTSTATAPPSNARVSGGGPF